MSELATQASRKVLRASPAETMARHYRGLAGGNAEVALRMLAADRCAETRSRRRKAAPVPQDDARG